MAMSKNDVNIVESLIRGGASSAEIMSEIEKIEARIKVEEEAKKKAANAEKEKIAKRDAARTKLIEAVMQYALDFGWVEKKDISDKDIQELDKALRAEEKVIEDMKEFGDKFFKWGAASSESKSLIDQIEELLRQ